MSACKRAYTLRKGRFSVAGGLYVVTCVTEQRRPVFRCFDSSRLLIREMRAAQDQGLVESFAFVIMPDHLHWLFRLNERSLGDAIGKIKARSSLAVNRHNGCTGRLWQKGFYDRAVRKEEDLKNIARYIIMNPVEAGLCERIGEYPFWDAAWL
ncbi:REP-associated tyrosine transposase [Pseudomonas sp. UBA4194]|uniref:REP-associated tyrosine transposase n=1 Tax=Pseudomonas sp. UBA4194 TaxID=1947317 RepID=UPI0025D7F991|nr:transposase [Pseudomonas sp. UBA4194]